MPHWRVSLTRSLPPQSVVAAAGLYRTGKSFLLNALLNDASLRPLDDGETGADLGGDGSAADGAADGAAEDDLARPAAARDFGVGSSVQACTKGVWLSARRLPDAEGLEGDAARRTLVVLDTEGLGSTERSGAYDCRVFSLALLLASVFIYNSRGTIDGDAVSKLSLVVQLTKHIRVTAHGSDAAAGGAGSAGGSSGDQDAPAEFASVFPHFFWAVRDFAVRLERDGRKISANEYLESALRPRDDLSEKGATANAVRRLLTAFFPQRDCLCLATPVEEDSALASLGTATLGDLRPGFRRQLAALRRRVLAACVESPKRLYGRALTGAMLADLAEAYVAALNDRRTPTISTAWKRVVQSQCDSALQLGLTAHSAALNEAAPAGDIVEDAVLAEAAAASEAAALAAFNGAAVEDANVTPAYRASLREKCAEAVARRTAANRAASQEACEAAAAAAWESAWPTVSAKLERLADSDSEDSVGLAALTEAAAAALTAAAASYSAEARGPARSSVLAAMMRDRAAEALREIGARAGVAVEQRLAGLRAAAAEAAADAAAKIASADSARSAAVAAAESDRRAAADAASRAAKEAGELRVLLQEAKDSVAAADKRLLLEKEASERAAARAAEHAAKLAASLDDANSRAAAANDAAQASLKEALASSREAAAAREDAAAAHAARAEAASEGKEAAVDAAAAHERAEAAARELARVTELMELLHARVEASEAATAKVNEKLEAAEYGWGEAKAQHAQAEHELLKQQEECHQLRAILTQLKDVVSRAGKSRAVTLPARERRIFDAI